MKEASETGCTTHAAMINAMPGPPPPFQVIGTDAGGLASLPPAAEQLLCSAGAIAAPQRLLDHLPQWWSDHPGGDRPLPLLQASDRPDALISWLRSQSSPVVILASGDPLWFGIGRRLLQAFPAERLNFHPAPCSMQLAFARIGRPWQDATWVSLHGRSPEALANTLQSRPAALAVLTDPGQGGAATVRQILRSSGLEASYAVWLCENLGHRDERVMRLASHAPLPPDLQPLLLVLLIAEDPPLPERLPLFGLEDGVFLQHPDRPGLMTKREIRLQLLAELELPADGVIWDLGAGTGSVGLEALRLRPRLQLLAIERRGGGAALIEANAQRLGVQPAAVLEVDALTALNADLPPALACPDRVLLGGGGRDRIALLQTLLPRLTDGGIVVIPLATLEALSDLRTVLETGGLTTRISQLQAWRGLPLGDGTRLAPMNPTLILKGTKSMQ